MRLPIFFITFVLFVGILALKRRSQERKQQDLNESFLDRERRANLTRKQDISGLDFLKFSLDALPPDRYPDEELLMLETELIGYHDAKIINLSHYSNTSKRRFMYWNMPCPFRWSLARCTFCLPSYIRSRARRKKLRRSRPPYPPWMKASCHAPCRSCKVSLPLT